MQSSSCQNNKNRSLVASLGEVPHNYSPQEIYMKEWNEAHVKKYDTGTIGSGVKTNVSIKEGSIVLYFHGPILPGEMINDFDLALQLDVNTFMDSAGDIDDFVNHSCSPNTILVCRYHLKYKSFLWCLVAIRDIFPEEEVTFDYSLTMSGKAWSMDCRCGTATCRGVVGDFIDLKGDRQQQLLKLRLQHSGIIS